MQEDKDAISLFKAKNVHYKDPDWFFSPAIFSNTFFIGRHIAGTQ